MSANRDERVFAEPFRFDVARDPNPHLGFGQGVHYCLGANLARLEMRVMFEELFARFDGFELTGPAVWTRENRLLGLKHLPVRLHRQGRNAMKAAVLREVKKPLTIEDVQVSKPGPHEVLVRTAAAGVCHSDLHFQNGSYF